MIDKRPPAHRHVCRRGGRRRRGELRARARAAGGGARRRAQRLGHGVCDDGVVIDLSLMRGVRVDPERRTVWAQGGCTWADIDRETQPFGLAVPGGVVSETGIAGLTLSGGYSNQRRAHGMTIDNLVACELVTADGRYLQGKRGRARRPLLGASGRRRELRRGDRVRVHGRTRMGRPSTRRRSTTPSSRRARCSPAGATRSRARPTRSPRPRSSGRSRPSPRSRPSCTARRSWSWSGRTPARSRTARGRCSRCASSAPPIVDASGVVRLPPGADVARRAPAAGRRYYWKGLYLDGLDEDAIDVITERSLADAVGARTGRGAPARRGDGARARGGDRLRRPQRAVPPLRRRNVGGRRRRRAEHRLGEVVLGRTQRFSSGQVYFNFAGLLEEGEDAIRTSFGAELRPAGRRQDRLRPREPLPPQPEHRAEGVRMGSAARLDWAAPLSSEDRQPILLGRVESLRRAARSSQRPSTRSPRRGRRTRASRRREGAR